MKPRLPDPRDVAARKALAARPSAPLESVFAQAAASKRMIADSLRDSRSKHLLNSHDEAVAQFRRFRQAMDVPADSTSSAPSSSAYPPGSSLKSHAAGDKWAQASLKLCRASRATAVTPYLVPNF